MLVELADGNRKFWVNPIQVRQVRPSWSSTSSFPRTELVFGNDLKYVASLYWFLFPSPVQTVDGSVESIVQKLNDALTTRLT